MKMAVVILAQRKKVLEVLLLYLLHLILDFCSVVVQLLSERLLSPETNKKESESSLPMLQLVPKVYDLQQDFAMGNGHFFLMFSKKLKFMINMVVFLTLFSISHI